MPPSLPKSDEWLSLKVAADLLGVHVTTLRRWADNGEIPVVLTPGGHRRFIKADIEQFSAERRRLKTVAGLEQLWVEQALSQTRQGIATHRNEHWLAAFDAEDREHKRQLGRRLVGLMLKYISLDEGGAEVLEEAAAVGREYAENIKKIGLPLVEAIRAVLFFRDMLVEVTIQLPEVAQVRPEANTRLLRRINTLLNTVQLAIVDDYDRVRG